MCASIAVGALATSGSASLLALTTVVPAIWLLQPSRCSAYCSACCYYLAALRQIPGILHSLPGVGRLAEFEAIMIWLCTAFLLSVPWALARSRDRRHVLWLAPAAQVLSIVPPLGLIGLACPASAAGLLLPGTGWAGIAVVLVLPGVLVAWPRVVSIGLVAGVALIHLTYAGPPLAPKNWQGINTSRPPAKDMIQEYAAIDDVITLALQSSAGVIVFPETAVPRWTPGAEAVFGGAFAQLRATGKTIVFGSTVEIPPPVEISPFQDIANAIRVLDGDQHRTEQPAASVTDHYRNVVVIRGMPSGLFTQRIPAPIAMWRPFSGTGVPLNLAGPATIPVNGQQAGILICYEQLLAWPILASVMHGATIVVGIANTQLDRLSPVSKLQALYLRSWTQLFGLPCVTATNE